MLPSTYLAQTLASNSLVFVERNGPKDIIDFDFKTIPDDLLYYSRNRRNNDTTTSNELKL